MSDPRLLNPHRTTASGRPPVDGPENPAPDMATLPDGQHKDHWVLSAEERRKGFIRPVRDRYQHLTCHTVTTMGRSIAETYAIDPRFYGSTFCVGCGTYRPVGAHGEFVWVDVEGRITNEKVGT